MYVNYNDVGTYLHIRNVGTEVGTYSVKFHRNVYGIYLIYIYSYFHLVIDISISIGTYKIAMHHDR